MICDLHSPDTFDTRLGERASANVQPCVVNDSAQGNKFFAPEFAELGHSFDPSRCKACAWGRFAKAMKASKTAGHHVFLYGLCMRNFGTNV